MKLHYLLLLLSLLSCHSTKRAMSLYGPDLFQHWTHSFEDDADGLTVYRPANYQFPPARGREGFELKKDGTYIRHAIGAADGKETMEGTWKMQGQDRLLVALPQNKQEPAALTIVSLEPGMLKLRKE